VFLGDSLMDQHPNIYQRNVAPHEHLRSVNIATANTMATMNDSVQRFYYHEDIDFAALGLQDEEFAALLTSNDGRIDWQDPSAIQYDPRAHFTVVHTRG